MLDCPIVSEAEQPDSFIEVLDDIELMFTVLNLSWQHPRVIQFIDRLHARARWIPPSNEAARLGLSYRQLKALLAKLEGHHYNPESGGYGDKF